MGEISVDGMCRFSEGWREIEDVTDECRTIIFRSQMDFCLRVTAYH